MLGDAGLHIGGAPVVDARPRLQPLSNGTGTPAAGAAQPRDLRTSLLDMVHRGHQELRTVFFGLLDTGAERMHQTVVAGGYEVTNWEIFVLVICFLILWMGAYTFSR